MVFSRIIYFSVNKSEKLMAKKNNPSLYNDQLVRINDWMQQKHLIWTK